MKRASTAILILMSTVCLYAQQKQIPVIPFINESLDFNGIIRSTDDFVQESAAGAQAGATLQAEVKKYIDSNGYELYLQARSGEVTNWIYVLSDKKNLTGFIFFEENGEKSSMSRFTGQMPLSKFKEKVAEAAQKDKVRTENAGLAYNINGKDGQAYSFSDVKMKYRDASNYTDILDYLRGRVPGVKVFPDGTITVRGVSSVNSGTQPLFIVDGVEVQSIDGVRPMDVSSIQVLKDASASIYGARGANGVILIKTKVASDELNEAGR